MEGSCQWGTGLVLFPADCYSLPGCRWLRPKDLTAFPLDMADTLFPIHLTDLLLAPLSSSIW